jgi:hypothetical protein
VLVAYLEHRDRLLEAERDRVLHEVSTPSPPGCPPVSAARSPAGHRRRRPPP